MLSIFRRHNNPAIAGIYSFIFTVLCLLSAACHAAPADSPAVIVHPGVAVDRLSRNVLRSIFSMRLSRWSDGSRIQVFVLADTAPLHKQFSKQALGVFPYQLRQIWDRVAFSGIGEAPIRLDTEQDMYTKVAQTPGAIGYVNSGESDRGVRYVVVE